MLRRCYLEFRALVNISDFQLKLLKVCNLEVTENPQQIRHFKDRNSALNTSVPDLIKMNNLCFNFLLKMNINPYGRR